jgi:uncharacterized membrane protein YfcA
MIGVILIGLAGGAASGLLGIGGGVVLVPLLTKFLRLPQRHAHGTSLAILVFTAIAAAVTYRAHERIDLVLAAWLALGATLCAPLGARMTTKMSGPQLRRWFGLLIVLVGLRMFMLHLPEGSWLAQPGIPGIVFAVLTGCVVGWLSGLMGVGGGTILVPILTLLFGIEQHHAQGISLFMVIPTAISGGWTHLKLGNVEKKLVPPIAAASVVAAIAAAMLANRLPATVLKILFGALLVWVGARMAWKSPSAANETTTAREGGGRR